MVKAGHHLRVLPETRGECVGGARPCPMVSCRYHLLLDVAEDGRLFLTRDLDEGDADSIVEALASMPETCALDVAERGGMDVVEIGRLIGLRRQGVQEVIQGVTEQFHQRERENFDEREHPEDFYIRYSNLGADELSELASELRRRNGNSPPSRCECGHKKRKSGDCVHCHLRQLAELRRKAKK